jgi:hypothetical protein
MSALESYITANSQLFEDAADNDHRVPLPTVGLMAGHRVPKTKRHARRDEKSITPLSWRSLLAHPSIADPT